MKDQLWEEKWEDFSKKEIREEIGKYKELSDVCEMLADYIKNHRDEVAKLVQSSEGEDYTPWRSTETYSLDLEAEGHSLSYWVKYAMDQDGGEDDPEGEFYVDDVNVTNIMYSDCPGLRNLESEVESIVLPY